MYLNTCSTVQKRRAVPTSRLASASSLIYRAPKPLPLCKHAVYLSLRTASHAALQSSLLEEEEEEKKMRVRKAPVDLQPVQGVGVYHLFNQVISAGP